MMRHAVAGFRAMGPMVGPRAGVTLALETDDKLIAADAGWHRQALRPSRALATGLRRRSQSRKPATIMVMGQRPMAMERRRPISPPASPVWMGNSALMKARDRKSTRLNSSH